MAAVGDVFIVPFLGSESLARQVRPGLLSASFYLCSMPVETLSEGDGHAE
jgi:hypothetical protein